MAKQILGLPFKGKIACIDYNGLVVHSVRTLACHARGREFESLPGRQLFMREWLSGRASPCQGECREFESRLPLHLRRHSQVVRQRSATPSSPVQIWVAPPFYFSRSGGTGRRTGLKILRRLNSVPVRFRSSAPRRSKVKVGFAPAFFIPCI